MKRMFTSKDFKNTLKSPGRNQPPITRSAYAFAKNRPHNGWGAFWLTGYPKLYPVVMEWYLPEWFGDRACEDC